MALRVYLYFLLIHCIRAETWTCDTDITDCAYDVIHCNDWEECILLCTSHSICKETVIYCPSHDYLCSINCLSPSACNGITVYGASGDLSFISNAGYGASENANIHCPANKQCNVTCTGSYVCQTATIYGENVYGNASASVLNLQFSGYIVLKNAKIYCPSDPLRGNHNQCNLYGTGDKQRLLESTKIYAVESFTDFNLYCDGLYGCFWDEPDPNRVQIYCGQTYSSHCYATSSDHSSLYQWQCVNTSSECNTYILPTPSPTISPTPSPTAITQAPTAAPSHAPITYSSAPDTHTLYVRSTGCDYGYCDTSDTDFISYCKDDAYFTSNPFCCSGYNTPTTTYSTIPDECYDVRNITVIDTQGVYTNSAISNKSEYSTTYKAICFQVVNTTCFAPVVTVEMEAIPYTSSQFGYQAHGQYLHAQNTWFWAPRPAACGKFIECSTNNVDDKPWLPGVYLFYAYLYRYPSNYPFCDDPLRSMHVRIHVDCSAQPESTCATMQYTWDCFNGIGGNPDINGCSDEGYDGNGVIDIGAGTFQWNDAIDTKHHHIVLQGNSYANTQLNHSVDTLIRCQWIQCSVTISKLTYIAPNRNPVIYVNNGGTIVFSSVVFENNYDFTRFVIDGEGSTMLFSGCYFSGQQMVETVFTVTNAARLEIVDSFFDSNVISNHLCLVQNNGIISIENTHFISNTGTSSKAMIKSETNASLHIIDSLFDANHIFSSLIDGVSVTESTVFDRNYDIPYLIHGKDTNNVSIILKSKFWPSNNCTSSYCVSFINSDLWIDEVSAIRFTPTESPTAAPTMSPTSSPLTPEAEPLICGQYLHGALTDIHQIRFHTLYIEDATNATYYVVLDSCYSEPAIQDSKFYWYQWKDPRWVLLHVVDDLYEDILGGGSYSCPTWYNAKIHWMVESNTKYGLGFADNEGTWYGNYNVSVSCSKIVAVEDMRLDCNETIHFHTDDFFNVKYHELYITDSTSEAYNVDIDSCGSYIQDTKVMFVDEDYNVIRNTDDQYSENNADCVTSKYQDQVTVYAEPNKIYYIGIGTEFDSVAGWQEFGNYTLSITCTPTTKETTASPTTIAPTQSPNTLSPTLAPTAIPTKILQFGHTFDSGIYSTLYLYEYQASLFDESVDLIHFGALNGTIRFEPCEHYNNQYFDEYVLFDATVASRGWVQPTNIYNVADIYVKTTLECIDSANCYMQCIDSSFVCVGSTLISTIATDYAFIECDTQFACLESTIFVSSTRETMIKCAETGSCRGSSLNINNVEVATVECIAAESCTNLQINITNVEWAQIRCYGIQSCESIRIYSDINDIHLLFYNANDDVHIYLPNDFDKEYLNCNPLDAYLTIDGSDKITVFNESARDLFGGGMPCENVVVSFTDIDRVDCEIRYEFPQLVDIESVDYIQDFMSCYNKIYIDEISTYDCFGSATPTRDPTTDPTIDPTIDPTVNPTTDSPTKNPSMDPTKRPTNKPTVSPTSEPTLEPTIEPTMNPTVDPSVSPTKAPTKTPTRQPTHKRAYDSFFDIAFLLINVLDESVLRIIANSKGVFANITELIEVSYVENITPFLEFSDFQLIIDTVNNMKISKINDKNWVAFVNAKDELRLQSRMLCNNVMCNYIIQNVNISLFEHNCAEKIRHYFGDITANADTEQLTFKVDTTEAFVIQDLYPQDMDDPPWKDPTFIALMSFVATMTIFSGLAFLHNKGHISLPGTNVMDDGSWNCFLLLALQIWDFVSDINLSVEMLNNQSDGLITIISYASLVFILLPYVSNLLMASRIKSFVASNEAAITYFTNNSGIFVLLVCFCGSCYVSLQFVSSAVFGLNIFNSGLTGYEIRKLSKLKVVGTIFLENLPQICLQIIYSVSIGDISANTWLSFVASSISVIAACLTYCIEKGEDSNENWRAIQYYICTENNYSQPLTESVKNSIKQNKGRTEALRTSIASLFSTHYKTIEISKAAVASNHGVIFHVVHFVNVHDIASMKKIYIQQHANVDENTIFSPQLFVYELYSMFKTEVDETLRNHLELDKTFSTKLLPHHAKNVKPDHSFTDETKLSNLLLSKMLSTEMQSHHMLTSMSLIDLETNTDPTINNEGAETNKGHIEMEHIETETKPNDGESARPITTPTVPVAVDEKREDETQNEVDEKKKKNTKKKKKKTKEQILNEWFKKNVDLDETLCVQYCALLISNGFNSKKSLKKITDQDLVRIGIKKYAQRKAILTGIKKLVFKARPKGTK